jgi:hypothetical protein
VEKGRILDEFCKVTGYNRKYALRVLNGPPPEKRPPKRRPRRPTYGPKVVMVLTAVWKAAGYPVVGAAEGAAASMASLDPQAPWPDGEA